MNKISKILILIILLPCCITVNKKKVSPKKNRDLRNVAKKIAKFSNIFGKQEATNEEKIEVTTMKYNDSVVINGPEYIAPIQEKIRMGNKKVNKSVNKIADKFRHAYANLPSIGKKPGNQCWEEIGCLSGMSFDDANKTRMTMLPLSPDQIDQTFYLLIESPNKLIPFKHNFDDKEILDSPFDPKLRTVVITHGYFNEIQDWMHSIVSSLNSSKMSSKKFNYILVDWSKGAKLVNYALAAANTKVVGRVIAYFIKRVCKTYLKEGVTHEMFHLIGHSLGSHTMGFAGKELNDPKVYRITGLDPAGPGFKIQSPEDRLHYTDASKVIIIHTDISEKATKGLGYYKSLGDIDFYPNGGMWQPDCPESQIIKNILTSFVLNNDYSCSHNKAPKMLYLPDDNKAICLPVGYLCESWETFLEGRCASCGSSEFIKMCHPMGLFPDYWDDIDFSFGENIGDKYYLNTGIHNTSGNICIFHYQMAFHLTNSSDVISKSEFDFTILTMCDKKQKEDKFRRTMSQSYPGHIQTLLVTFDFEITKFISLTIGVENLNVKFEFIEINYMSNIDPEIRKKMSVLMCPGRKRWPKSDNEMSFIKCENKFKPAIIADSISPIDLMPFTKREDIKAVDHKNEFKLKKKIKIKNKD